MKVCANCGIYATDAEAACSSCGKALISAVVGKAPEPQYRPPGVEMVFKKARESRPVLPSSPVSQIKGTAPEPLSIAASDLFTAYDANEIAADQRYKGQTVRVTGKVSDIGKDITGTPYVVLSRGRSEINAVQCMFPRSAESAIASLQKGQSVGITATVSGKLGNVILRDSRLY